jgi:hypothetical protein
LDPDFLSSYFHHTFFFLSRRPSSFQSQPLSLLAIQSFSKPAELPQDNIEVVKKEWENIILSDGEDET